MIERAERRAAQPIEMSPCQAHMSSFTHTRRGVSLRRRAAPLSTTSARYPPDSSQGTPVAIAVQQRVASLPRRIKFTIARMGIPLTANIFHIIVCTTRNSSSISRRSVTRAGPRLFLLVAVEARARVVPHKLPRHPSIAVGEHLISLT